MPVAYRRKGYLHTAILDTPITRGTYMIEVDDGDTLIVTMQFSLVR